MDWANQPDPFRRYEGVRLRPLARGPAMNGVPYGALFDRRAQPQPFDDRAVAGFLRYSMGLSAWKATAGARWALRVNPSSGNLHPTEAYIVRDGGVAHYAPREHALEERAQLDPVAWQRFSEGREGFLVALSSVTWREAWKYGERAFRYCQHDVGHAIAALRLAAAGHGWRLVPLTRWSDAHLATLLGLDRETDWPGHVERETPEYLAVVTQADGRRWQDADPAILVAAAREADWHGVANQLSAHHVEWAAIDRVAATTTYPGRDLLPPDTPSSDRHAPRAPARADATPDGPTAGAVILRRRSAVAFDGRSSIPVDRVLPMLARLQPGAPPWDAIDWGPHVHLVVFVHRVEGLIPGVYAYLRDDTTKAAWRSAMRHEFLWEPVPADPLGRLFLLVPTDVRLAARRLSCDQDIAADGFFSVGMIARFAGALRAQGESFYRRLFWECGIVGQVLYLEAEAAGARGTGIGCFYDDAVNDVLGLSGTEWQSLYHFSMGAPIDDPRLTTEPGYPWEAVPAL